MNRMNRTRLLLASTATGAVLAATVLGSPPANADAVSGCEDTVWFMPFQSTRRAICDGVKRPDGSWLRVRVHYTPAHYVPRRFSCTSSRYSSSCTETGGYTVAYREASSETYVVFDDNVLPTEPAHLVNNARY